MKMILTIMTTILLNAHGIAQEKTAGPNAGTTFDDEKTENRYPEAGLRHHQSTSFAATRLTGWIDHLQSTAARGEMWVMPLFDTAETAGQSYREPYQLWDFSHAGLSNPSEGITTYTSLFPFSSGPGHDSKLRKKAPHAEFVSEHFNKQPSAAAGKHGTTRESYTAKFGNSTSTFIGSKQLSPRP